MIQERAKQKEEGKEVGETHLFFGCRHREKDFIYREELEKYAAEGYLTLHTAFSRDGPTKVYVTDRMRENSAKLWELLDQVIDLIPTDLFTNKAFPFEQGRVNLKCPFHYQGCPFLRVR